MEKYKSFDQVVIFVILPTPRISDLSIPQFLPEAQLLS